MSLEQDLKRTEVAYQTAASRAEALRVQRNAVVRQALAEGWSNGQVAGVIGLSRGRIGQLRPTSVKPS